MAERITDDICMALVPAGNGFQQVIGALDNHLIKDTDRVGLVVDQDCLEAILSKYSSHSTGSRYFFLLLQSLHAGTRFPFVLFPPLVRGTI